MVVGTGIDIIDVQRVHKAAQKPAFISRVFTNEEQKYFEQHMHRADTIAGTFAAKEAVAKALATGFDGVQMKDIEIRRDEKGAPHVALQNGALRRMLDIGGKNLHISISHINELAIAQAILED